MLVLLWGLETERPMSAVREELARLGAPGAMVDQRRVFDTRVRLRVGRDLDGAVWTGEGWTDLSEVTAVYLRPYDSRQVPAVAREGPASPAWRHASAVDHVLAAWSELTPALVVNRLGAMASNNSKPYQQEQLRKLGFAVPETLITTDPEAAREFWEQHEDVIFKSIGATRSIVSRMTPAHAERLSDVGFCPTQFQRYISGTDHRVHVVGEEVFACEVLSSADDYRYPGQHTVDLRACRIPRDVEDRCRFAASALGLHVAGIDLRRTPEGEWYCFEANPSPAFTFYENRTGQPIARAIASILAQGAENVPEDTSEKLASRNPGMQDNHGTCRATPRARATG